MTNPKLSLVGAGPGDPELITLKAIKALKQADVVLYDALANEVLLNFAPADAEKIFVGKRGHQNGISQDQINLLIVEKALKFGHVVRLKGGDPFVFGRGLEEIEFAKERGLEVAYIPGISSIFGAGNHFIPLTDRRAADGFWVITGHKSDKKFSDDLFLAVKSNATIVLLMAMSKLEFIVDVYKAHLKNELPIAVIQNASTNHEKWVVGTMNTIFEKVQKENVSNPAIIVIGEVVKLGLAINEIKALSLNEFSKLI